MNYFKGLKTQRSIHNNCMYVFGVEELFALHYGELTTEVRKKEATLNTKSE